MITGEYVSIVFKQAGTPAVIAVVAHRRGRAKMVAEGRVKKLNKDLAYILANPFIVNRYIKFAELSRIDTPWSHGDRNF